MGTPVNVHVYDLSNGMARAMSMAIVGKQVDIVPHTGVVLFGKEYFFGGGICVTPVGQAMPMPACEMIPVGTTAKTEADLQAFLLANQSRFTAATYNLLSWNCNHFSNEVVKFLTDGAASVPDRIVNVAQEALSAPQGAALRKMLEGMQNQMAAGHAGNQLNPLGHVPSFNAPGASGAVAAPASPSAAAAGEQLNLDSLRAALKAMDSSPEKARRACLTTVAKRAPKEIEPLPHTLYVDVCYC